LNSERLCLIINAIVPGSEKKAKYVTIRKGRLPKWEGGSDGPIRMLGLRLYLRRG